MIAVLLITLAVILIYSTLYKQKADAIARKIRNSEYGYLYILAAIMILVIAILIQP
jgi:hypothetical protein